MSNNIIKNKIILGILNEFKEDFGLKDDESKSFEKLVNYVVLSKIDPEVFSDVNVFDSIDVDKSGTFGIDTFALVINDHLVTNKEDIAIYQKSNRMDTRFIFIQTKRSSSVESGDLLKFGTAVENFFSSNPSIPLTEELQDAKDLVDELFKPENARIVANGRSSCELYYATSGKKTEDSNVLGIIDVATKRLKKTIEEISEFSIKHISSDYIIDSYNEIENTYKVNVVFDKNISCGHINGVEQSFIGYMPVSEFLKLIKGQDGNIRKNLFYENVRDFQGENNAVNTEIASTLLNPNQIDQFLLLNNGVTIVTKSFINLRSTEYEISDYYIVNGCQTSNVIYQNIEKIENPSSLNIPIKIVHTTDNNIITNLIRSTNRQTPVPDEAFVSLEKFHKRLQEYYKRYGETGHEKIYYERRSKEFSNSENRVEKQRIINLHAQIRSFISVVIGEPQLVMSNNPTSILKEHKSKMFQDDHVLTPYYLSSLLLFIFYELNQKGKINSRYTISRYWICWITRILAFNNLDIGNMNSTNTEKKCESVIESLANNTYTLDLFRNAIKIYDDCKREFKERNGRLRNAQLVRLKAFRELIKINLASYLKSQ